MPKTHLLLDSTDGRFHEIQDAMAKYHQPLHEAKVSLTIIVSSGPRDKNGDVCGPAVSVNGYPAMAAIKATNLKQRAAMLGDAILEIDGDRIDELSDAERAALWDHELTHLEIVVDKDGAVKRDDLGRPKLKSRKHDFQIGGFHEIAERHKTDALETQQINDVNRKMIENGCFSFSGG